MDDVLMFESGDSISFVRRDLGHIRVTIAEYGPGPCVEFTLSPEQANKLQDWLAFWRLKNPT